MKKIFALSIMTLFLASCVEDIEIPNPAEELENAANDVINSVTWNDWEENDSEEKEEDEEDDD